MTKQVKYTKGETGWAHLDSVSGNSVIGAEKEKFTDMQKFKDKIKK